MDTFILSVHLPGHIVKILIIKKSIDKIKEMCYTLVTIKKGNENYENCFKRRNNFIRERKQSF